LKLQSTILKGKRILEEIKLRNLGFRTPWLRPV